MGGWGGGWLDGGGGAPTHMHMHVHACTHVRGKHDNFMQMAAPIGDPWEFPMMSYLCGGHPLTIPTHIQPPPHPPGGTPRISQNSIALELIEIFQFCLKI